MPRWSKTRWTTEESKDICINQFIGHDYISGTTTWKMFGDVIGKAVYESAIIDGERRVKIAFTYKGETKAQHIKINTTPCQFGGKRYWFGCPSCGENSFKLYRPGDAPLFACRECYNLTYNSCNENRRGKFRVFNDMWRQDAKIEKLEKRMKRLYYAGKPTKTFQKILES